MFIVVPANGTLHTFHMTPHLKLHNPINFHSHTKIVNRVSTKWHEYCTHWLTCLARHPTQLSHVLQRVRLLTEHHPHGKEISNYRQSHVLAKGVSRRSLSLTHTQLGTAMVQLQLANFLSDWVILLHIRLQPALRLPHWAWQFEGLQRHTYSEHDKGATQVTQVTQVPVSTHQMVLLDHVFDTSWTICILRNSASLITQGHL